jgi:hypothetical protein
MIHEEPISAKTPENPPHCHVMAYSKVIVFDYYKIGHVVPIACMHVLARNVSC